MRKVRGMTAEIKVSIRRHSEAWFPREQNVKADQLSKLALTHQEFEAEWVEELDAFLQEYWAE